MKLRNIIFLTALTLTAAAPAQEPSKTWNPNVAGNKYRNPIIDADYSDPDVCRVGNDYYMTASSFACFPGLQILHSTDLVNWQIVGTALTDDYPVLEKYRGTDLDWHRRSQHGNYVWAPSIRYHDGWFYIYWGDPDQGLFMTKARDVRGPWEKPVLVKEAKGLIDCCPLWDDDGRAYLSHGCAGSRAGVKSVLFVAPMSPDGTHVTGPSRMVYDGHEDQPTIEGTKFYKRNGYYYIMSPAGGVKYGWQVELRSKNPFGPYDEYVGMAQGKSKVNGPHQGAWVDTQNGEDWFIHFQDKHAYGRVIHLQPARWVNDWLVIGNDADGDGCGDPVSVWKKPNLPAGKNLQPSEDDDFNSTELGPQWQFEGPFSQYWYFCDAKKSRLRLYGPQAPDNYRNVSDLQNALLQKLPTENFTATARVRFIPNPDFKPKGEEGGFVIMGLDYAGIKFVSTKDGCAMRYVVCKDAQKGAAEQTVAEQAVKLTAMPKPYTQKYAVDDIPQPRSATPWMYVRAKVHSEGTGNAIRAFAQFAYSKDGKKFTDLGQPFEIKEGKWIGAKIGFYCMRPSTKNDSPFFDVDWIHFTGNK
ncbi:glycoside hydrolase family 43 protein [Prevotella lacticifex]|uniref:Glycoside hydrolase n=1 Tax=Prevotella lacticifex TaxID=2854755 RepID=A0A9R1C8X0_9BACT|nr:glycoside hydrolase 43 family protein [Prevotella lacticifex]GJG37495.1 glycoside hydrolase [Prevotella lacticifex]GJG40676.1 glycoside hydrolase [Prevotella lacticifex]GJG44373.1 glycoside hydrolase [Prevotella lacticifex]GJG47057.1 glycoside hydrolase [Prevotella lacticifex]GJG50320.1 glycoside hydrolase [Prevotella lacticifex]